MATDAGVELEYVRIGAEGLIFITHKNNPTQNITDEQVLGVYCDETVTNWKELGGADGRIVPICRNADSGSQAQMDNLILKG
jgi:phosphate transport system substrate-binding protein